LFKRAEPGGAFLILKSPWEEEGATQKLPKGQDGGEQFPSTRIFHINHHHCFSQ
jgi:hypothetical protein